MAAKANRLVVMYVGEARMECSSLEVGDELGCALGRKLGRELG
jgi:hypothetical protein